ncbi:hypothetical protein OG206_30765 [Streptomyces sp. NBC_01341]|uniref:GNAT family N-acetyltransferase n=1 Tax=Streptomyces sp. NBC_01341 TaxID=2903831 RepID=UPI002E0F7A96|nr:hypothetical protein OG206_30765 [Streptomyces sp. NBC_01341]
MSSTVIRLVEPSDGPALADLLDRDKQVRARLLPARPAEFYTPDGQASVITSLLASHGNGLAWPGVVVLDGTVIGQIGISSILRGSFQTRIQPLGHRPGLRRSCVMSDL